MGASLKEMHAVDLLSSRVLYQNIVLTLFAHRADDGNNEVFSIVELGLNLFTNISLRNLDIVFGTPFCGQQVEETVIDVDLTIPLV